MTRQQEIILLTAQITKRRRDKKKTSHLVDKLKALRNEQLAEETGYRKPSFVAAIKKWFAGLVA